MLQLPKTCGIVTQDSSVTAPQVMWYCNRTAVLQLPKTCGTVTQDSSVTAPQVMWYCNRTAVLQLPKTCGTVTQDSSVTAPQDMCYCNSTAVLLQLPKSWAIVTGQCSLIHEACSDLTCVAGTACRSGRPVV